eukprot:13647373-Alexandrium_andersonii.AAC.1
MTPSRTPWRPQTADSASVWGETAAQNRSDMRQALPWGSALIAVDRRPASTSKSWNSSRPAANQGATSSGHRGGQSGPAVSAPRIRAPM